MSWRCPRRSISGLIRKIAQSGRASGRLSDASSARGEALADVADAHGATPAEVALAWLLELSPAMVAIPGARRPETARSAARAAKLELEADDREVLANAFGGASSGSPPAAAHAARHRRGPDHGHSRSREDRACANASGSPGSGGRP